MTTPLTDDTIPEEIRTVERLRELRSRVTAHMGGPEAVDAIHAAGRRTAREHIAELADGLGVAAHDGGGGVDVAGIVEVLPVKRESRVTGELLEEGPSPQGYS